MKLLKVIVFVMATIILIPCYAEGCIVWPKKVFKQLDYGIYWLNTGSVAGEQAVKADAPIISKNFYNPKKPTVIYFHGWAPGSVKALRREDFCYRDPNTDHVVVDALKPWKARGWNVGIFYWQQFSDEIPWLAQQKVYTGDWMRYKYIDDEGHVHTAAGGTHGDSMPDAAVSNFVLAMQHYSGPEVRIVGHSLGGQLAIQFTQRLVHALNEGAITNTHLMPKRLTLLDPVFSPLPVHYSPDTTAEKNLADLIFIEGNHIAVDGVNTSTLSNPTSEDTKKLQDNVAMSNILEKDINKSFFEKKYGHVKGKLQYVFALHRAARFIYFNSLQVLPEVDYPDGGMPPSAATSNERTLAMMHDGFSRKEISGTNEFK